MSPTKLFEYSVVKEINGIKGCTSPIKFTPRFSCKNISYCEMSPMDIFCFIGQTDGDQYKIQNKLRMIHLYRPSTSCWIYLSCNVAIGVGSFFT